mgnify:CR=1 FL=1
MQRNFRHITVHPIAGALGAKLSGVELSNPLGVEVESEIHQAFLDHLVIFFRDQDIAPQQELKFAQMFGEPIEYPQLKGLPDFPLITEVVKLEDEKVNFGGVWHSDITFLERPALGSILYAIDVPDTGGDTLFANQELAFERLSTGLQQLLSELRAVHSDYTLSDRTEAEFRNKTRSTKLSEEAMRKPVIENLHPVVRTHPETGRKSLFVSRAFTVRFENMTVAESKPLLEFLYEQATRPEFTCRFHWEKGSVAIWDNRCVQHYALNDYHGQRRYMHRVTVNGDRPA